MTRAKITRADFRLPPMTSVRRTLALFGFAQKGDDRTCDLSLALLGSLSLSATRGEARRERERPAPAPGPRARPREAPREQLLAFARTK